MNRIISFSILTSLLIIGIIAPTLIQPTAAKVWYDPDWLYRKKLTIDHTKVECDLQDFPVLIDLTDTALENKALDNGYDIVFTDANHNKLNHEIERFNGGTGRLVAWVQADISSTLPTDIFMYFGNAGVSGSEENPEGVWDDYYEAVYHLSETGTVPREDSTINDIGLLPQNYDDNEAVSGKIDGADQLGGGDDFLDANNPVDWSGVFTVSMWVKGDSFDEYEAMFSSSDDSGIERSFQIDVGGATDGCDGNYRILATINSDKFTVCNDAHTTNWQHITVTFDGTTISTYNNGELVTHDDTLSGDSFATFTKYRVGSNRNGAKFFDGTIDELRISNVAREKCWIKTSYTNQNNPSGFLSSISARQNLDDFQSTITVRARIEGGAFFEDTGIVKVDGNDIETPQVYVWFVGETHTLEAEPVYVDGGDRYVFSGWNIDGEDTTLNYVTPTADEKVTALYIYKPDYYLTINSRYDTPIGQRWYDQGTLANFSLYDGVHMYGRRIVDFPNGTRAAAYAYQIDALAPVSGYNGSVTMSSHHTVTIFWETTSLNSTVIIDTDPRYWDGKEVKVDGVEYDTELPDYPSFSWVNATVHTIEALTINESSVNRFVWDYWVDDRLGDGQPAAQVPDPNPRTYVTPDPDGEIILKAVYQEQFYLTINSDHGDPQGEGWYDRNSDAMFNVTTPFEENGARYNLIGYTIDGGSLNEMANGTITMDAPHIITFLWDEENVEYYLAVNSEYGTTHGEGWYSYLDDPTFYVTPEFIEEDGVRHILQGWTGDYIDGANPAGAHQIIMDGPKNVTAVWRDRFFIEIISPYGSPKGSSWPFKGENFEVSVTSPDSGYVVTGYEVDDGSLQPGSKYMFVNVQEPHTIEFFWGVLTETTIYTLNCNTNPANKGTISVGTTEYEHGESVTTIPGIYTIAAEPDEDYEFYRWQTSGGVTVSNPEDSTTSCTLSGDGTLTMIQNKPGEPPPPSVWGGPETRFNNLCIIATAAYGSPMAPEVAYMRNVRDNMIGSTPIGKTLVTGFNTFYYSWSPPVAQWIADSEGLRTTFRVLLLPISAAVRSADLTYTTVSPFNPSIASLTAFVLAAAIAIGTYIIAPIFTGLTIYRKKYASHI